MPKSDPSPPVFRYTGRRTGPAPFPGVPMRDLYPDDVERLPLAVLKNAIGGVAPLYVPVDGQDAPVVPPERPDLGAMTRADLNVYAVEYGVADPDQYRTKDDLIAAIEAASPPADTGQEG